MPDKEAEQENGLLWENQGWVLSNLDDYGYSDEKDKEKPMDSAANSPEEIKKKEGMISKKRRQRGISNGKGSGKSNKEGKGGGDADHEIHIWTERERRKKMRNMFTNLHALLPQLPAKADKSTIVDEALNYIKTLQQTLQNLQKQKLEKIQGNTIFEYAPSLINHQNLPESREAFLADQGSASNSMLNTSTKPSNISPILKYPVLFRTWTSSNVVLNICGDEAQISICSPEKPGLFTAICYVLDKHNIEVLSAHVCSDCSRSLYMIQAHHASGADQFGETLMPLEEIYRQAVGEIMCLMSS